VVVDVWRSFTTTTQAFAADARDILAAASVELDRLDFVMRVERLDGLLVMKAQPA
jgi:hypothetical protein